MSVHCPFARKRALERTQIRSTAIFRSSLRTILIAVFLSSLFASCAPARPTDPVGVVQAAYDRYNKGDLNGYLRFFSDEATVCAPLGCSHGIEEIREYISQHVPAGTRRYELSDLAANGNVVTYVAKGYEGNALVETVSDGLDVVVDGRIIFDGTEALLRYACDQDASQAFCAGG
jgi:hypothetical protein